MRAPAARGSIPVRPVPPPRRRDREQQHRAGAHLGHRDRHRVEVLTDLPRPERPRRPHHHRYLDGRRGEQRHSAGPPGLDQDDRAREPERNPEPPDCTWRPLARQRREQRGPHRARRQKQRRETRVEPGLRPEHETVAHRDEQHPDAERRQPPAQRSREANTLQAGQCEAQHRSQRVPRPRVEKRIEALQADLDREVRAAPDHADRGVGGRERKPRTPRHRCACYANGGSERAHAAALPARTAATTWRSQDRVIPFAGWEPT